MQGWSLDEVSSRIGLIACPKQIQQYWVTSSVKSKLQQTGMSISFGAQATYSQPYQNYANTSQQPAIFTSNGQFKASYSSAAPSTSTKQHPPQPSVCAVPFTKEITSVKKPANAKRTAEEYEIMSHTAERYFLTCTVSLSSQIIIFTRLNSRLAHDQGLISHPDVDSQFVDETDVIKRLLPYHIFQQPKEDLTSTISGKAKANVAEKEEIRGKRAFLTRFSDFLKRGLSLATKSALECFKRREAIRDRWRKLKIRSGKVSFNVHNVIFSSY